MEELDINIFSKYRVKIKNNYSYLSPECESKYDNIFINETSNTTKTMDGGEVIELLYKRLQNTEIIDFRIVKNTFIFDYFNPFNGEGGKEEITVRSIKK